MFKCSDECRRLILRLQMLAPRLMKRSKARWILMAHDRIRGNVLPLTHEFLALMLGVKTRGCH